MYDVIVSAGLHTNVVVVFVFWQFAAF